ncbi:MAG: glycosyltransferase [Patescibacteria group bacterium]
MKRTRIVIVINDFLVGGAQRLLAGLVAHIDRTRFDITLVTLRTFEGRNDMYHLLPADLPVHRLSFRGFFDIPGWIALAVLLVKKRPQVVLSNLFFSNTITRVLGLILRYPTIIVEHNTYVDKTKAQIRLDRFLSYGTKRIVAVSPTVQTFTMAQEGIQPDKFTIIQNGVDVRGIQAALANRSAQEFKQELGLDPVRRYIVNVSRLVPQKNQRLLLEGFSLFAHSHPDYDLLMVGDGGERQPLTELAKEQKLEDRIRFLGSQQDVFRFYGASEFFVSTSSIEGFGLAHAEALAAGLPLVSTRTAGPDRMIEEGRNGFFIDEETPEGVAAALERMVRASPDSMRAYARESASHFSIEKTARAYEALIEEVAC